MQETSVRGINNIYHIQPRYIIEVSATVTYTIISQDISLQGMRIPTKVLGEK